MAKQKKSPPLTDWEREVHATLRALQPGLFIETVEERRALMSLRNVAVDLYQQGYGLWRIRTWSTVSCSVLPMLKDEAMKDEGRQTLHQVLDRFLQETVTQRVVKDGAEVNHETPSQGILLLADVGATLKHDPIGARALREAMFRIREEQLPKIIVAMGREYNLPAELQPDFAYTEFRLPTVEQLYTFFDWILAKYRAKGKAKGDKRYATLGTDESIVRAVARACAGLSENEGRSLVSLALSSHAALDQRAIDLVLKEKARIVRREGLMDIIEPKVGLDDVGGLENLKDWVLQVSGTMAEQDASDAYGVRMPSGALFVGVPGCGKSYMVEAMAKHFRLPLMRLDVGRCMGGLVGQSEGNIRKVFRTAEALAPCMLFIDEIEKALGGGDSQDGGTTERVKGSVLTWLQEKPQTVFVAATANDLNKLANVPELIRAGRIDATFFVDLPDYRSRIAILGIQMRLAGHPIDAKQLETVAAQTIGFSGAELRRVVETAVRMAFNDKPRPEHPRPEHLQAAAKRQKPLSITMKTSIDRLREWALEGRAEFAGAPLESGSKEADVASFKELGMPML